MVPDFCLGKAVIVSGSASPKCASAYKLDHEAKARSQGKKEQLGSMGTAVMDTRTVRGLPKILFINFNESELKPVP